ncbi:MAG: hypothetical protein JKY81_04120 [Colwellia sp.]|nr:hypothetical protein [Colwellia sp.]
MLKKFFARLLSTLKNALFYLVTLAFVVDFYHWLRKLTVVKLLKVIVLSVISIAVLGVIIMFALVHYPATQIPVYEKVDQTVYLDQGWGKSADSANRQLYYYTPQGTTLKDMEYDWFAQLEMPWGQEKFSDPDHLRAYGFIVDDKKSADNPFQLPVGFTQHYNQARNAKLLDITCAACHSGQLNLTKDGKRFGIRIDGGQAMHAFTTMKIGHFVPTMIAAMVSTYGNPFKFERFAKNVLHTDYNDHAKAVLKDKFGTVLMNFLKQGYNDVSKGLYPLEEGFGRTDALTRIGNTVFGDNLADKNYHVATGPVSYPPVWNIWKFDWVQYGASVKQPMARNMGEALGVGAHINFTDSYGRPLSKEQRFISSVMPLKIHQIESSLQVLTAPKWPESIFGEIDTEKAARGSKLFTKHCAGCHGPFIASDMVKAIDAPLKTAEEPLWLVKTFTIDDIGTDANAAFNFINNRFDLSKTGLSNEEIINTVRPLFVRQLQRLATVALKSTQLADLLGKKDIDSQDFTFKTQWLANNAVTFAKLETSFSGWQSSYSSIDTLASDIEKLGDSNIQLDIKTMLIKNQLTAIDKVLNQLNINSLTVGEALNITGIIIRDKYYQDNNFSIAKQACLDGYAALDLPQQLLAYKARPLAGIWATPPFLHNGSVPNIYQLLSPVTERDESFYVGRREYDTQHLGYVTKPLANSGFKFNTLLSGNKNMGHEFRAGYVPYKKGNGPQFGVIGPELSPTERLEIIEYLKIHQDSVETKPANAQNCAAL